MLTCEGKQGEVEPSGRKIVNINVTIGRLEVARRGVGSLAVPTSAALIGQYWKGWVGRIESGDERLKGGSVRVDREKSMEGAESARMYSSFLLFQKGEGGRASGCGSTREVFLLTLNT